jgi:hypothetical protein
MFGTTMQAMQGTPLARYIPRDQRQQRQRQRPVLGDTGIRMRMKGRRTGDYAVTGSRPAASTFRWKARFPR